MMDTIFDICVKIMEDVSPMLGLTYKEFNVILFVIVHPLITLMLFTALLRNYIKNKLHRR